MCLVASPRGDMADQNLALGRLLFFVFRLSVAGRRDSAELGGCAASTLNSTRSLDRTQLHAFVRVYK
jgi:hypothetical protein